MIQTGVKRGTARSRGLQTALAACRRRKLEAEHALEKLESENRHLRLLVTLDALTGIANRRCFDERLEIEWKRAARKGSPISIIMVDIDDFKTYNDTYGHQMGDQCLRKVARAMMSLHHRPGDVIARYGGEEFAMVLPETPAEGAHVVGEKLRTCVEALGIGHAASRVGPNVTVSIGAASVIASGEWNAQALLREADEALYLAKKQGRNRVAVTAH